MTILPALTELDRLALIIGLSDAQNRRRIHRPETENFISRLIGRLTGRQTANQLSNPRLEALRAFAMHAVLDHGPRGRDSWSVALEAGLSISARRFLESHGVLEPRDWPHEAFSEPIDSSDHITKHVPELAGLLARTTASPSAIPDSLDPSEHPSSHPAGNVQC